MNEKEKGMEENRKKRMEGRKARKYRMNGIKRAIDVRYGILKVFTLKIQFFCITGLSIRFIYSRRFEGTYRILLFVLELVLLLFNFIWVDTQSQ
jgi:hypothetical protein